MFKKVLRANGSKERQDIVGVIVEESAFAVGCSDGIPLLLLPIVVSGDEDISGFLRLYHRQRQTLNAVGSGYLTAVSNGLLHIILVLLNYGITFEQCLEPRNRWEICYWEDQGVAVLRLYGCTVLRLYGFAVVRITAYESLLAIGHTF